MATPADATTTTVEPAAAMELATTIISTAAVPTATTISATDAASKEEVT